MHQESEEIPLQVEKISTVLPPNKNGHNFYLYIVAATVNLISFTMGIVIAWPAAVLPKLYKDTSDNPLGYAITHKEASWIVGFLPLGSSLGSIVAGKVADKYGRKTVLIIAALLNIASLSMTTFGKTVFLFYFARFLSGVCCIYAVLSMYLSEISENHNRGALSCSIGIFLAIGANFTLIIGPYLSVQIFCLVCMIPMIIFIPSFVILAPETPAFLASSNNTKRLFAALVKLRNKTHSQIDLEMTNIVVTNRSNTNTSRVTIGELFKSKNSRKGFTLSAGLFIFQQSTGYAAFISFLPSIFSESGGNLSPEVKTMIIGTFQVVGSLLAIIIVDRLGRRMLLLISSIGMCLTLASLGSYFYLKEKQIQLEAFSWIPVVSFIIFILAFGVGFGPVPWAVMAEVFLPNVRATAASIASFLCFINTFIVTVTFPSLCLYLGMAKCFFLFCFIAFGAIVFIYWLLPETKGKSIQEIQQLLDGSSRNGT